MALFKLRNTEPSVLPVRVEEGDWCPVFRVRDFVHALPDSQVDLV